MKVISAGVIIINDKGQVLACLPSGHKKENHNHCDIPKGHMEIGETPLQTAIRETFEETGIDLKNVPLIDCGQHAYIKNKDLHLFKCRLNVNLNELKCTTYFKIYEKLVPEVVDYYWINEEDIKTTFYKSLCPLILDIYSK